MTLKEYTAKKFEEGDVNYLLGKTVRYKNDPTTWKISSIEGDIILLQKVGKNGKKQTDKCYWRDVLFAPETTEEWELYRKAVDEDIANIEEHLLCIKEVGFDKITEEDFMIWKLMKAIKEEKDDTKLKEMLRSNLKVN